MSPSLAGNSAKRQWHNWTAPISVAVTSGCVKRKSAGPLPAAAVVGADVLPAAADMVAAAAAADLIAAAVVVAADALAATANIAIVASVVVIANIAIVATANSATVATVISATAGIAMIVAVEAANATAAFEV